MKVQPENSPYRCRNDGKRMVQSAGQNENEGDLEVKHECWSCGWSFTQRPERDKTSDGPSMAELRDKVRAGKPMPPPAAFEPLIEETQR